MKIQALLSIGAIPVSHKEIALGHLSQIILVQELAVFALFAEPSQPMLADKTIKPTSRLRSSSVGDMAFGASRAV